jgi:hypothetical protein
MLDESEADFRAFADFFFGAAMMRVLIARFGSVG